MPATAVAVPRHGGVLREVSSLSTGLRLVFVYSAVCLGIGTAGHRRKGWLLPVNCCFFIACHSHACSHGHLKDGCSLFLLCLKVLEKAILTLLDNSSKRALLPFYPVLESSLLSYHKVCHPELGKPPTLVIYLKAPQVRSN